LRNIAIILAVAILATYAFIAVNEAQKERVIRLRLPKFRKINKYEFDKALYQIRETRAKKLKEAVRVLNHADTMDDSKEDFYRDYEYLENLKNAPSTDAQPIQQEPSTELQEQPQQEDNLQGSLQEQQQQEPQQGGVITTQDQQLQQQPLQPQEGFPARPILRPVQRYQQPTIPQANTNNGNM